MKVSGFGCLALVVGTNCGSVFVGSVAAIGRGLGSRLRRSWALRVVLKMCSKGGI